MQSQFPEPTSEGDDLEKFLDQMEEFFGGEEAGLADLMSGFLEACEIITVEYLTKDVEWQIYIALLVGFKLAYPELTLNEVKTIPVVEDLLRDLDKLKDLVLKRSKRPDITQIEYTTGVYAAIEENDFGVVDKVYNEVYLNRMDDY